MHTCGGCPTPVREGDKIKIILQAPAPQIFEGQAYAQLLTTPTVPSFARLLVVRTAGQPIACVELWAQLVPENKEYEDMRCRVPRVPENGLNESAIRCAIFPAGSNTSASAHMTEERPRQQKQCPMPVVPVDVCAIGDEHGRYVSERHGWKAGSRSCAKHARRETWRCAWCGRVFL